MFGMTLHDVFLQYVHRCVDVVTLRAQTGLQRAANHSRTVGSVSVQPSAGYSFR